MNNWTTLKTRKVKNELTITKEGKIYLPAKIAKSLTKEYCYIMTNELGEIGIKETNEKENTLKIYNRNYQAVISFKKIFDFGYKAQKYEYEINNEIIRIKKQA